MAKKSHPPGGKKGEKVMVVARADLFRDETWNGLRTDNLQKFLNLISKNHTFLSRDKVENDPAWQQIIPYLVFRSGERIFLMRRKASHTDRRLANLYSIGIGGHINIKDIKSTTGSKGITHSASLRLRGRSDLRFRDHSDSRNSRSSGQAGTTGLINWARREFEEEIDYKGKYKTGFLGILNDDSNDVGLVHLGLVIEVVGESDKIAIRDEHKTGKLMRLSEVAKYLRRMETWSRIVYDFLVGRHNYFYSSSGAKWSREVLNRGSSRQARTITMTDNIVGILPDRVIEEYIAKGAIKITPLAKNWRQNIDQVSIDFHLGGNIKLFRGGTYRFIDTRRGLPDDAMEEVNLREGDPFILEPGAFAIASTREVLKLPNDILGRLEGKSSLARLGILVHSTAARFDPGWNGAPVLELGNLGPKPAILYCGMPICAFTFEKLAASVKMPYEGSRSDRYSGTKVAVASRIHQAGRKVGKRGKKR